MGYAFACCDLDPCDLLTQKQNQYVSRPGYICDLILVKLGPIELQRYCSVFRSPAATLTFDLLTPQNQISRPMNEAN